MKGIPDPGPFWRSILERIPPPSGGSFYIVGGWVRNLFLFGPRGIGSDIDLAVPADLSSWAPSVSETLGRRLRSEPGFLTARTEFLPDGSGLIRIDMSQFRRETYDHPGSLPRVFPGTLEEDLLRRDFTMNAMMLEWSASRRRIVRLIDPFGGRNDLREGRIRLVRSGALNEDPTRILRWARLSVRLGLESAPELRAGLRKAVQENSLWKFVGTARIFREFERLREEPDPLAVLLELSSSEILSGLLGVTRLSAPRQLRLRRWLFYRESLMRARGLPERERAVLSREMFHLAIFFGMSRTTFQKASSSLGLGKKERDILEDLLFVPASWPFRGFHEGFVRMTGEKQGRMAAVSDGLSLEQVLLLALLAPDYLLNFWKEYIENGRWAPPLLGGKDLAAFRDILPSERGRILSRIRELQRAGRLASRDEALTWVRNRSGMSGASP